MQLADGSVWQSSNEGFSWQRMYEGETILSIIMHGYNPDRAYLVTNGRKIFFTTDTGRSWNTMTAPLDANPLGIAVLDFHPTRADWIIFAGSIDCVSAVSTSCRAVAHYSTDNGRRWKKLDEYVRTCTWARDSRLKIDEREILCESYKIKKGSQRAGEYNPMELIAGKNYYSNKIKLFDSVVGFATFSEYLIVAEVSKVITAVLTLQLDAEEGTLRLQVSLDGIHFTEGQFPPSMKIANRVSVVLCHHD